MSKIREKKLSTNNAPECNVDIKKEDILKVKDLLVCGYKNKTTKKATDYPC